MSETDGQGPARQTLPVRTSSAVANDTARRVEEKFRDLGIIETYSDYTPIRGDLTVTQRPVVMMGRLQIHSAERLIAALDELVELRARLGDGPSLMARAVEREQ